MKHPGQDIIQEIRARAWTQKYFSLLLGKKVSEVNELIKGKRNITIQRDLLLSKILGSPEKFRIQKQLDYDYDIAKADFDDSKIDKQPQKQPKVFEQTTHISSELKEKKIATNRASITEKKQSPQPKNKTHEGIFRDF